METNLETIRIVLEGLSVVSALFAAVLWFRSSNVNLPKLIQHIDYGFIGDREKPEDDMDRLTMGLSRQSRLSAKAALSAGIAASFQVGAISIGLAQQFLS